ncbi:MAG: MGMT family protein [Christensenellales bacterium]
MNRFFERVYEVVDNIPSGKVMSYGQIAGVLGNPRMARRVGSAMRNCPDRLPAHRVIRADGSITGGAYAALRRDMLKAEGVAFLPDGRVDMERCRWRGAENVGEQPEHLPKI